MSPSFIAGPAPAGGAYRGTVVLPLSKADPGKTGMQENAYSVTWRRVWPGRRMMSPRAGVFAPSAYSWHSKHTPAKRG